MQTITIVFKTGETREFHHRGRAGGSWTIHAKYEGEFVIVEDEWGNRTAFPSADVKEVREVPHPMMSTDVPRTPAGTPLNDEDDYDERDPEAHCQTCHGEGWEFCEDQDSSEGCWEPDCDDVTHTCPNCRGSGLAKDQWFW